MKAMRLAPRTPICKPGQVVEIDESMFERFRGQGVFVEDEVVEPDAERDPEPAVVADVDVVDEPTTAPGNAAGKPKPTDSIEKHREYATKHGIDPKGLSRAQLVKAIRDL